MLNLLSKKGETLQLIKLKGNSLIVNHLKFGSVTDSGFQLCGCDDQVNSVPATDTSPTGNLTPINSC